MSFGDHDLAEFPSIVLYPDRVLYRIHRAINDPVYFAFDENGRFNLTEVPGSGTCYLSASA